MKEKLLPGLFAGGLGLLMLFYGIALLGTGNGSAIAVGVFALLFGLAYLGAGFLILARLDEKIPVLGKIASAVNVVGYPIVLMVNVIVAMVNLGAPNIGVTAWIMDILLIASVAGLLVFSVFCFIKEDEKFLRFRDIGMGGVIIIALLMLVFTQDGGINALGNIRAYDFASFVLFAAIAFFAMKESLVLAKDKLTAARAAPAPKAEEPEEPEEKPEPEEPEEPEEKPEPEEPEEKPEAEKAE